MKHVETVFGIFFSLIGLAVIAGILYAIATESRQIKADYVSCIVVDKSEKVPQAISNAVENVRSRNFVVTGLKTVYVKPNGNFVIECSGTEDAHILEMGK